jgi:rod shape-determining protein MreD
MHNWFVILCTLLLAVILALLPMPELASWFRPPWVLMVLIFWSMMMPYRVSVGMAWVVGIMMDLLNGTLLGEHALAFTIVIYFVSKMHMRLRFFPLLQQGISIFLFVLLYQFIIYCVQGFIGDLPESYLYWLPPVTSMILWPWLYVIMRDFSLWVKVA